MFLPEEDKYSYTKEMLESQLSSLFGGRVAEALIFGADNVTTGASNDIQRATEIARNMVTKWGLSEKLGPLTYGEDEGEVFLGHSVNKRKEVSEITANVIDQEVKSIIERNYQRAEKILNENIDKLHMMAKALIQYETIDSEQLNDIMRGKVPRPPVDWDDHSQQDDDISGFGKVQSDSDKPALDPNEKPAGNA